MQGLTKDEIFRLETLRMREAYRLKPDWATEDADTWDLPEVDGAVGALGVAGTDRP